MGVRRRDAQVALHEGHQGGDVWLGSTIRACKGTTPLPVLMTKLPGPTNPEDSRLERRRRDTRSLERGRQYLEATAAAWREWDEDRLRSEVDGLFLEGFVS